MSVSATRHRRLHMEHYARVVVILWGPASGAELAALVADRVYLEPFDIDRRYTIDHIAYLRGSAAVVAQQVNLGIYEDNGDAPDGGALLASTGAVAVIAGTNQVDEVAIGPITLDPGLYWAAQVYDTGTLNMIRRLDSSNLMPLGGTLFSRYYDAGAFTLTDPCPVTSANTIPKYSHLLVSAIP